MDNIEFYEKLRAVPAEAQKKARGTWGEFTDINPMWRIKRMTELFGPCGLGWYVDVKDREVVTSTDGKMQCTFVSVDLYIKVDGDWSKPIHGEGGNTMTSEAKGFLKTSDEAYKMAFTDAISNATKMLGLGADVWFERDSVHGTKYDKEPEQKKASPETKTATILKPTPAPKNQAIDKKVESAPAHTTPNVDNMDRDTLNAYVKKVNDARSSNTLFNKEIVEHIGKAKDWVREDWLKAIKFYVSRYAN